MLVLNINILKKTTRLKIKEFEIDKLTGFI